MIRKTFKWFLPAVLIACFTAGPAAFARGRHARPPVANRIDRRQDRRALQRESRQIAQRRQKLRTAVSRFGPRSPQARAIRRQIRRFQRRRARQTRDLRQDRRQALRH